MYVFSVSKLYTEHEVCLKEVKLKMVYLKEIVREWLAEVAELLP